MGKTSECQMCSIDFSLPPLQVFDFPTISALTAHIHSRLCHVSSHQSDFDLGSSSGEEGSTCASLSINSTTNSTAPRQRPYQQVTPTTAAAPCIIALTASASRSPGAVLERMMVAVRAAADESGQGGASVLKGEDGVTRIPHIR